MKRLLLGWILVLSLVGLTGIETEASSSPLKAKDVYLGENSTCAVLENNGIKCWGINGGGLLKYSGFSRRNRDKNKNIGDDKDEMGDDLQYMGFPKRDIKSVGVGAYSICVQYDRTNEVYCKNKVSPPKKIEFKNVNGQTLMPVQIATGMSHHCAIFTDDSVGCWGHPKRNSFGFEDRYNQHSGSPQQIVPIQFNAPGEKPVELVAGPYSNCVLFDSGRVRCWGGSYAGALGNMSYRDSLSFMVVDLGTVGGAPGNPGMDGPLLATKLYSHSSRHGFCAKLMDRSIKCWGENKNGQLGIGSTSNHGDRAGTMGDSLPAIDFGQAGEPIAFAPGGYLTCALFLSGTPKCWGLGGRLGIGTTESYGISPDTTADHIPFINLGHGRSVVKLKAGGQHACAVLSDGSLTCWGRNIFGQLGLGHRAFIGDQMDETGDRISIVDLGTY